MRDGLEIHPTPTPSVREESQIADQRFLTHLDGFLHTGFSQRISENEQQRVCPHWPLDGVAKVRAASRALLIVAMLWERADAIAKDVRYRQIGCVDVEKPVANPQTDALLLRAATAAAEIGDIKFAMRSLSDDFQKISVWLAKAAGASWEVAKAARSTLGCVAVLGEDHRVIAKDWLAADMNALIAGLLRAAVMVLNRLELTPTAINADLLGRRDFEASLHSAAEMLDRAGALATESGFFVDEFDQRWVSFRQQIATVVALSRAAVADTSPAQET